LTNMKNHQKRHKIWIPCCNFAFHCWIKKTVKLKKMMKVFTG
jgi:hypothetical protein